MIPTTVEQAIKMLSSLTYRARQAEGCDTAMLHGRECGHVDGVFYARLESSCRSGQFEYQRVYGRAIKLPLAMLIQGRCRCQYRAEAVKMLSLLIELVE